MPSIPKVGGAEISAATVRCRMTFRSGFSPGHGFAFFLEKGKHARNALCTRRVLVLNDIIMGSYSAKAIFCLNFVFSGLPWLVMLGEFASVWFCFGFA